MPPIPLEYLDCVFYLYSSAELAKEGSQLGGSGFLVGVPLDQNKDFVSLYAITNNHVVKKCGDHPAIRLNKMDGSIDVLVTTKQAWKAHPYASDVAAMPIDLPQGSDGHRFSWVHFDLFVRKEWMENFIRPGDDTFMVGRFVNVQGQQRNTPALRFGNVAMLPFEPIEDEEGLKQQSFLVECRSIPGYSGSPVFVYDPQKFKRGRSFVESWDNLKMTGPWLLGIDRCHIKNFEPVYEVERQGETLKREECRNLQARSNTSMAGVIPAWILTELLFEEEFVEARQKKDEEVSQRKAQMPPTDSEQ